MKVEPIYAAFGSLIVKLRKREGWKQQDLADITGLSRGSIANIETGRQRVFVHDMMGYAAIFKIKPQQFYAALLEELKNNPCNVRVNV